ncbi:MAG: hypothetical protein AAGA70_08165 [Pseudomonadota bacterium]
MNMFRFFKESRAAVAFEAVIITPILAWCFVGSFIFFDAFRTYNTSLKATYAIADVISRQGQDRPIFESDIDGYQAVFDHISRNPQGSSMRVSQIHFNGTEYLLADNGTDSFPTGGQTRLRPDDIPGMLDQLPIMAPGEYVIIVETWIPYIPYFDMGLNDIMFTNFTVTRPRFTPFIRFDDGTDPTCTSCVHDDNANPTATL